MLTLQNLLESDSLSTIVAKLNNNFQVISLSGGGPLGKRGVKGLPGLPGRQGNTGSVGPVGPTGVTTYMIPFATGTSGGTGPTQVSGPWPVASLDYLENAIGTGTSGSIFVDHYNKGFWMFLEQADGTGQYSNVGPNYPPDGTGYFGGSGWYFYPEPEVENLTNVWTLDYTTYFNSPPYATGPWNDPSILTIPNAKFNSKYGTVWISSGGKGSTGAEDYNSPTVYDWGIDYKTGLIPQAGRWNAGVDRLLFKFSLDSLPYRSAITAREETLIGQPANQEDNLYPEWATSSPIQGSSYWVKPIYSTPLDQYTPLFFWSEVRPNILAPARFATLGLYQYTAYNSLPYGSEGAGVTAGSTASTIFPYDKKGIFLLSTRLAPTPEDYVGMTGSQINNQRTINLSEMVLDVKRLTTTNQLVCTLPQDLKLSSDYTDGTYYKEGSSTYKYKVFQGFISAANGKNTAGNIAYTNYIDYGSGIGSSPDPSTPSTGNETRRSWYGSAFRFDDISSWGNSDSSNPLDEGYIRLAGMNERGKKNWDTGTNDTNFLSELVFYTSQFKVTAADLSDLASHSISSQDLLNGNINNQQNSLPVFYLSPYRNVGVGTFTQDDLGVWEPQAKFHSHVNSSLLTTANDPSAILTLLGGDVSANPLDISDFAVKAAAFTASSQVSGNEGFIDFFLGMKEEPNFESANPSSGISTPSGNFRIGFRREGWYNNSNFDSLRFGVKTSTSGTDIGSSITSYKNEYQIGLHPLNTNASDPDNASTSIAGFGIHNLWPRARFHVFGKNKYNEADRVGEVAADVIYPGYAAVAQGTGAGGAFPYYTPNYASSNQVITDFIADSYLYPTGILEYEYKTYGGTPFTSPGTGSYGTYSPNAANYPLRDKISPTRHYVPYGTTGDSGALYAAYWNADLTGVTGVTGMFNSSFRHDGLTGSSYKAKQYIGFNIFRDLMNVGDNKTDTNTWVIGTNGGLENGGSTILTNGEGDFAISTIAAGRDGGEAYAMWDQKLSTRDILNNIKLIVKKDGSVGFGNAAGYDVNAYASQERNISTGYLNYVPRPADGNAYSVGPYTAGKGTSYTAGYYGLTGEYGLINYVGLSGSWIETVLASPASFINANTTSSDTFRAEFAADKLHGRPGRTIQKAGWGYPANLTIGITGTSLVNRYVVLKGTYNIAGNRARLDQLNLTTDFEGRITNLQVVFASNLSPTGTTGGSLTTDLFEEVIVPHPTEFNTGGPLNAIIGAPTWTAPIGAAAGVWGGTGTYVLGNLTSTLTFDADPVILGNIRMNNFVAGEGLGYSGGITGTADAATIKAARQQSPKLVFTFLEADGSIIPGGLTANRSGAGTDAYRKVNTVVASAQNESSLREYFIPKSDNSGGTFMVFTDHYGRKEKDSGFDHDTILIPNLLLEEVVTLEFLHGYTGTQTIKDGSGNMDSIFGLGDVDDLLTTKEIFPGYVLYKNSWMSESPTYGVTGMTGPLFAPDEYSKLYPIGPPPSVAGGTVHYPEYFGFTGGYLGGTSIGFTSGIANNSTQIRNIDKFYSVYNPVTNYDDGWNDPNITNKASEVRFKRINSEFALVDFNITVAVRNPNLDWDVAPGEGASATIIKTPGLVIDYCSPRWTQYIRLKYFPSADTDPTRNMFLKDLFGNGLGFSAWSSYKNWYSGVAVVGSDTGTVGDALTNTGESAFIGSSSTAINDNNYFKRWTGNMLNFGTMRDLTSDNTDFIGLPSAFSETFSSLQEEVSFTWATTMNRKMNWYIHFPSAVQSTADGDEYRSWAFTQYMGDMFQLMGNRAFSRNRNMQWRIVPQYGNYYGEGNVTPGTGTYDRNSFVIEVKFDDPILHIDTPLATDVWGGTTYKGLTSEMYFKYLTLSGQSIVRYTNGAKYNWTIT